MSALNAVRVRQGRLEKSGESPSAAAAEKDSVGVPNGNANSIERKGNAQHPSRQRNKEKGEKKIMSKNREQWLLKLYEAKGTQKTAVALANKTARMIHAILKSGGPYQHDLLSRRQDAISPLHLSGPKHSLPGDNPVLAVPQK